MRGSSVLFPLAVSLCLCFTFEPVDGRRVIRAAPNAEKTGYYIIKLNQSLTHDEFIRAEEEILKDSEDVPVYEAENDMIKVVTVKVNETNLEKVKHIRGVEYLEEETYAHGTAIPYSIDQLDKCSKTVDDRFLPIGDGEGVDIYILDSGIHYTHSEFEGRAKYSGKDPIDDIDKTSQKGLDCQGHGTHCASLAAGKTSGAAKKANLYSVRVLACNNFGPWSAIMAGLNHVAEKVKETRRPSVISMSLGGGYSLTVDNLVTTIVRGNIPVIVAAGNERDDACDYTPASNSLAITVGGSKSGAGMYYYTNGGKCVDIIAPGQSVLGADRSCDTCTKYLSGTSMATPLVAGVAAIHLQRQPLLTPAQVKQKIIDDSCKNVLDFTDLLSSLKSSTPNRLLHITGNCGGTYYVGITSSQQIISPAFPNNYPDSVECVYKLTTDRGRTVRLTIDELDTYDSSDYLQIIDGYYVEQRFALATVSGGLPSTKVYSSTVNAMTLRFVTNSGDNKKGFRAHFDSQPGTAVSSTPSTVTSTVTSTQLSTRTITSATSVTVTTLRTSTITSTRTSTVQNTITSFNTRTVTQINTVTETSTQITTSTTFSTVQNTVTSFNNRTVTEVDTIIRTETRTNTHTMTATSTATSTITNTATVTQQVTPTAIPLLMPSGTPTDEMCCTVLNNVEFISYNLIESMNKVMVKGIDYISKLVDKNGSFSVPDEPSSGKPAEPLVTVTPVPHPTRSNPIDESSIQPSLSNIPHLLTTKTNVVESIHTSVSHVHVTTTPSPVRDLPGLNRANPADSCASILAADSNAPSRDYWIEREDNSVIQVFCELEAERLKGMMRITNINMTRLGTQCPEGLRLIEVEGKRLCGRSTENSVGCSSVFFNASGTNYSKVCGKVHGYQYSSPNAFYWNSVFPGRTISHTYVDGVVLSYFENNKRNHIWTFAAAIDEASHGGVPFSCPCSNRNENLETFKVPDFVGEDYFCETGSRTSFTYNKYYLDDPLWDGEGCGQSSTCCNRGSVFCKSIGSSTAAPIELRVCGNEDLTNEDTPLEIIELYVQ